MAVGGLQEVDAKLLIVLHEAALQLGDEVRRRFCGDWRGGLDPAARAAATIAAAGVTTRLMEAMSWLLAAQWVAAGDGPDPGRPRWRAAPLMASALSGVHAEVAVAVERLYRQIIDLDAEIR